MEEENVPLDNIAGMNIAQRLHGVMSEAGHVQKTISKTGLKYNFIAHDSVMAIVQPLLVKYRVIALPNIKELTRDGNLISVSLRVTFINIDNPGDVLFADSFGDGIDMQDKGPGKAYSYAYKYAFMKTFVLATGDDPENDNINRGAVVTAPLATLKPPVVSTSDPIELELPPVEAASREWIQFDGCITEKQSRLLYMKRKSFGKVNPAAWAHFLKDQGWNTDNKIPRAKPVFDAVLAYLESGEV